MIPNLLRITNGTVISSGANFGTIDAVGLNAARKAALADDLDIDADVNVAAAPAAYE